MTIRITEKTNQGILGDVEKISGINLNACLQCRRCSAGCPVSPHAGSSPSEIIRRLQLNAGDELLDSGIIWMCASCETCFARCPMQINMAAVMDALRVLAVKKGARKPAGNMPLMNKILLGMIRYFGRTYDLGAMALYKAGTSTYLKDTGKFPTILMKGKIALLPPRGTDKKTVRRIFRNLAKAGDKIK